MPFSTMRSLLGIALAAALSSAQQILESASFGHKDGRVSPNLHAIPAWYLSGNVPAKIHSDRVVFTPPHPGGRQAAAWTELRVPYAEWQAEVAFRASGPDHGSGNLQIWYAKENWEQIGSNSIYTVGKFEGLAIVIDQQGGKGGGIRGFLNDGTTDFKNHHHLESLAFGHCDYAYRNLGRPSLLKIKQDSQGFEVIIDGRQCFRSNEVLLPADSYFGITAASAETPDSFEVFKFTTTTSPSSPPPPPPNQAPLQGGSAPPPALNPAGSTGSQPQDAQLAEILRAVQTAIQLAERINQEAQNRDAETRRRMDEVLSQMAKAEQVTGLQHKFQSLEESVSTLRKEVGEKDYTAHFNDLRAGLNARHEAMLDYLPEKMHNLISSRAPNLGLFIFLVLLLQLLLAAAYIVYKRRRATAPKKYL